MPEDKQIKAQKILDFARDSKLAIFDELLEMNGILKIIASKEIKFPEQKDFPEIPETDLSEVVKKLDELLKAIGKEKEPTKVSVKLEIV